MKSYQKYFCKVRVAVEPQHKMYWNSDLEKKAPELSNVEPQHKMYWNNSIFGGIFCGRKLNHNIRCIEIHNPVSAEPHAKRLNHNIRCIEILFSVLKNLDYNALNHNIRCIEMKGIGKYNIFYSVEPQHKMYWNYLSDVEVSEDSISWTTT